MKLLLTLVLCLASLLNGTSSYPSAPESAATFAIDELMLSDGSESATLPLDIRADIAIGTELSELHLEAEGDEGDAAELALQLAPDGLRFALGKHESVYLMSEAEAMDLFGLSPLDSVDSSECEALQQLLPPASALLGACLRDTSIPMRAVECAADALCEGKEGEDDSVRYEGGNMPAERIDALLDSQSLLKVLAALRESDLPEFQPLLNVMIPLYSLAQLPALTRKADADFSLPLSIYHHVDVDEGFTYTRIESADAEDPFTDRVLECEVVDYPDFSYMSLSSTVAQYDGDSTKYWLSILHSDDGESITCDVQSDDTGKWSYTFESGRDGNQRAGTCVRSLQLPGNDLVDADYNPIPDYSQILEYTISEDGTVNIHLEGRYFTEVDFALDLRATPSQADFQSRVDGLREVPVSRSDFSSEALESEESALGADVKALEQFLGRLSSDEAVQRVFDSLF